MVCLQWRVPLVPPCPKGLPSIGGADQEARGMCAPAGRPRGATASCAPRRMLSRPGSPPPQDGLAAPSEKVRVAQGHREASVLSSSSTSGKVCGWPQGPGQPGGSPRTVPLGRAGDSGPALEGPDTSQRPPPPQRHRHRPCPRRLSVNGRHGSEARSPELPAFLWGGRSRTEG